MIVFTICSNNYLAQALTLGESLIRFNSEYRFIIGLVDRKSRDIDLNIPYEIIEVEDLKIPGFNDMIFRYNIIELNTAVKPFYFNYLFEKYNATEIVYLDPDIQVFTPLTGLENELKNYDIIITPHITMPLNDHKTQFEEDFLNSGLYNLGFIAIKNSQTGKNMIQWWGNRLRYKAFIDFKHGLFTDQIWINFVPLFFENVKIYNNPGYNLAYWNLHERVLTKKGNRYFINSFYPLVFYHFSGYDSLNPEIMSRYQDRFSFDNKPDLKPLFNDYSQLLFKNDFNNLINHQCYYIKVKED